MNAVFAMQGFGQLAAALVALIVTIGFKDSLSSAADASHCTGACQLAADKMWRVVIGFGAVPGCIALYSRLTIPETPRYTFDVGRDVEKAGEDIDAYLKGQPQGHPDEIVRATAMQETSQQLEIPESSRSDMWRHFSQWRYGKILLGTALSWFFLDVGYFGLSLNNSIILSTINYSGGKTMYEILYRTAVGNLVLCCAGAIPGYWVSVASIDTLGRKPIQFLGFSILTILFLIIGFAYHHISGHVLLALYILAQFFFNFGPNSTTFIVPGECFPTRYRATSYGISAATGKIGAIVSQVVFGPLRTKGAEAGAIGPDASPFLNRVMQIFALFMFLGILSTFLIPETKGKSLEELAGEVEGTANYDEGLMRRNRSEEAFMEGAWT